MARQRIVGRPAFKVNGLHLHPNGNSVLIHPACYTLSRDEKRRVCEFLTSIKFPDGFASNIARCVKTRECKIVGMKRHYFHVFLHRLLPLAIRGTLRKDVTQALIELSSFFMDLCSRTLYTCIRYSDLKSKLW